MLLVLAALPPLAHAAETATLPHMVQHLLVVAGGAPLLGLLLAEAAPPRRSGGRERRAGSWLHRPFAGVIAHGRSPVLLAVLHASTVWWWHAPPLYRAAGSSTPLHLLQHASFTGTAVAAWASIAWHARRRRALVTVAGVACIGITGAVLGALLTFAPGSLTPGATTLDQQLAGVLMWAWGGLVSVGAAATVTLVALGRADRSSWWRSAPGVPAPVEP